MCLFIYVHMFLCGFVRVGFFVYIVCILWVFISTYTDLYLLCCVWVCPLYLAWTLPAILYLGLSINFSMCQYHSWLVLIYLCLSQCFYVNVCVCMCVCVCLYVCVWGCMCASVIFWVSSYMCFHLTECICLLWSWIFTHVSQHVYKFVCK